MLPGTLGLIGWLGWSAALLVLGVMVALIVHMVIRFATLGIFGLVASTLATSGFGALLGYPHLLLVLIGCIQSQSCHTNKCPTGVATQDPLRQRALVVPDKAQRVFNFHRNTLKALAEMLAAAGLDHPSQLSAKHLVRRMSATEIKLFSQLHVFLKPGELLTGEVNGQFYSRMWQMARADSFEPNDVEAA